MKDSWQKAIGKRQLAVSSWQKAKGSWQLAVGKRQLAVGNKLVINGILLTYLIHHADER
jgi:hypothetical protein